jgi:hypothetical protein
MPRASAIDRELLEHTLRAQYGAIARGQAMACGLTEAALKYRLRPGGPWQKIIPGVYLAAGGITAKQREMAALLHAGPRSVLTGSAAVRRYGLRPPSSTTVDVLVPVEVRRQSTSFVRVQRSARMPSQIRTTGQIRFAAPGRAVADAARALTTLRDVRALVSDAVQKRVCSIKVLRTELDEGPVVGSGLLRRALADVTKGIRSVTEGDLKLILKRARVPTPMFNARLFDGDTLISVVDCWWPDAGVAGEVDSREYHYRADDWQRTIRRHDRLVAHGFLVLHFTPQRMKEEPEEIVREILSALAQGAARPPLALKARPAEA